MKGRAKGRLGYEKIRAADSGHALVPIGHDAYVCGHCGAGLSWKNGRAQGVMSSGASRCFPLDRA